VSGVSGGTASVAHISERTQQVAAGLQLGQPCASISVVSQQPQPVVPSSYGNTSARQQVDDKDSCLNSSATWPAGSSGHPCHTQTASCQNSEAGLGEPGSVDVLESSQDVSDACDVNTRSRPADASQLQQSSCTAQSDGSPTQSQSATHSHVIEQLQQQLLRSSAKQTVNGCLVMKNGEKSPTDVVCKAEEGEVDSNELMQFLS